MKKSALPPRVLLGLFSLLLSFAALAQRPVTHQEHLPNLDRRIEVARTNAVNAARTRTNALANLRTRLPRAEVQFDGVGGGAKFVHARGGFLTGTNGPGRGVSAASARAISANAPHRPVKMFLHEHRELFGHGPEAVEASRVKRDYVTAHNGLRTVVWQQELDGLEVFEATVVAHTTAKEELVSVSSQMLPNLAQAADSGTPGRRTRQTAPTITAAQAVALAAREVGEELDAGEVTANENATGAEMKQKFRANRALNGDADARLVWLPVDGEKLKLCWAVVFTSRKRGEMFHTLIDAATGEAQFRRCLTHYISPISLRVYTSDSPTPFSPGHPTPLTNQPPAVARQLLTLPALNTNASPNGWIDDGVNETRGNNVDAHTDVNADNSPDLPRPQGSPFRVFDFPLDLAQAPSTYTNAAVAQLFYLCNWYHDKLYELGFTEAAGNFQVNNFGRGGVGNDAVQADAQDGSGTDNANFSTPPDGSPGRMQMYVFAGPTPDRDGDFDAEIVIHEYTHGLSWRLVGGGQALGTSQSDGMGEGWSDFYALALLSAAEDNVNGNYAAGGYATLQFYGLTQNYYYGIRRYPYSTDMTKNPLTFRDIDPAQASSHAGVPISPVGGGSANEVHNQGEVWCVTLWEARANLVNKHGWAVGNQLMLQLVTDGMKLTPPQPNFLQARDAILQADLINTGGANQNELWAAFAKRGMGYSATSPSSTTTTGVFESFDLPDDLRILPATGFVAVGPVGGPFNVTAQNFILTNTGAAPLNWSLASTSSWLNASLTSGSLAAGVSVPVNFSLGAAASSLPFGTYTNTVRFTNTTSQVVQSRTFYLVAGLVDYFTEFFDTTTNDLAFTTLTFTPDGSAGFYRACRDEAAAFPTDPAGGTAVSLADDSYSQVTLTGTNTVAIHNRRTNVFFIGSNGYLTMDDGDVAYVASPGAHFSLPRVAAVFDDLNPGDGGTISRRELSNRVAVTWLAVPEYGALLNTNSFQIELFFDGRIRVTWLNVNSSGSLAGLSAGQGVAIGFQESDLSAYGLCNPPLLVSLPASVTEGNGVQTNAGLVRLLVPRTTNLVINLASSDPSEVVVPATVTVPAGQTNAVFDLIVTDDAKADGTQFATVTATAPDHAPGSAVIAIHDNETAALAVSLPASATEGQGTVTGRVSISFTAPANIPVNLFSSDTAELQVPASVNIPAGQTSAVFAVTVVDDARIDNAQTSTVTARVQNWTDGAASLTVFDNEPLTLTVALPGSVGEAGGTMASLGPVRLADAGVVQLAGTLPTNLVVALASDNTNKMLVLPTVTIPAGQLSNTFDLFLVNNLLQEGNIAVSVAASAPGFTDGGATLLIVDDDLPPVIYFHPTNQSVLAGRAVSFGVTAVGGQPLFYQWRKDGTNLPAVTNATFTIAITQTNDAGLYSVVVSNLFGSVTSANATLTVTPAAAGLADDFEPGLDLVQWAGFGGTVGLTVLATNYGGSVSPVNSLWFGDAGPRSATTRAVNTTNGGQLSFYLRLGSNGATWEAVDLPEEGVVLEFTADGAAWTEVGRYDTAGFYAWTKVAVDLAPALQGQAVQFRWRQLSHSGLGTDHWALDDVMVAVPPGITKHPASRAVNIGAAVSFNVEATGSLPLNYQWSLNGTNLAAATNAALNLFNVTTNHAGFYSVVVTNAAGSATSSNAVLAVNLFTNLPPTLDPIASLTFNEDTLRTVFLTGIGPGGPDETNQSWILTAGSSSTGVVAVTRSYAFPSATGSLTLTPAAYASGSAIITVVVTDSGGTAFGGVNAKTNTFAVTVQSLNDRPTLNPMANLTINEDSGLQTVLLAGIGPGAANEAAQSLTFNAFTTDTGLVTIINAGANQAAGTGWINFRPVGDAVGNATITVILQDDGGTANGGVDASTNTFRVTISGVNDPPTLAPIGSLGVFEDSGPRIVNLTGLTAGPPDENGQTLSLAVFTAETNLLAIVATNYASPAATGSLTFQPVANANGTATITVIVTDNGGTANGGLNSVTNTFNVVVSPVNDAPGFTINNLTLGPAGATWIARESRQWSCVASSADGSKLVAGTFPGQLRTSTDSGVTWTDRESSRRWISVASSADGTKLVAAVGGYASIGQLYTSTDSGATWTARETNRNWSSVASSADGTKLVAVEQWYGYGGLIYTSTDSGVTWTARENSRGWNSVASSADGTKLVAVSAGQIYTSTDSGATWVARENVRSWICVASSSDGSKLVAAEYDGRIYTSTDSGVTWTARDSRRFWQSVASSADGIMLVAAEYGGQIYTSTDSGVTWTARESSRGWQSVASSSDGNKLVAAVYVGPIYTSSRQSFFRAINEDVGMQTVTLSGITSGQADENLQTLVISATSSNPSLIPHPSVSYLNGSTTGSLSFTPAANANGTMTITVIAQDDGGTANGGVDSVTNSFIVIVTPVNNPPTLNPIASQAVLEDFGLQTVTLTGLTPGPPDESGQTLTVSAFASNTNLVTQVSANYSSTNTTGTVSFQPVTNQFGTATITVIVRDSGGMTNGGVDSITNTFEVVVSPVNDPPTLNTLSFQIINEATGPKAISLTGISPGPTNESQLIFVSASCNRSDLLFAPSVSYTFGQSTGLLTLTPTHTATGTAVITVVVRDNGGTANGGVDAQTNTFTVTVVTPPKVLTPATNLTLLVGASASFSATATGTGPLSHQWLFNAQPLAGASQPTLTLNNLGRSNSGLYSIRVTNVAGAITSNNTWLHVLSPQRLERAEFLNDGRLRLQFRDELGGGVPAPADVVILTAGELNGTNTVWRTNSGGVIFTNGFLLFEDTNAPAAPRRFYKVLEK